MVRGDNKVISRINKTYFRTKIYYIRPYVLLQHSSFVGDLDFSQVIMRCQVMRRSVSHFIGCVNLHEPQKDLVLSLHVTLF